MKKNVIYILFLLTILGIVWLNTGKVREGVISKSAQDASKPAAPAISPDKAKALGEDIKSTVDKKLIAAGVKPVPADQVQSLFNQLSDIITTEVTAQNSREAAETDAENAMVVGNMSANKCPNATFFSGTQYNRVNTYGDAFCQLNSVNAEDLNNTCATLTAQNCNAASCCVWVNGEKCMAGNADGPSMMEIDIDKDYYSHKYTCRGNCNQKKTIPNAKSCYGYDCTIENQKCLSGTPGSNNTNWTCINKRWVEDGIGEDRSDSCDDNLTRIPFRCFNELAVTTNCPLLNIRPNTKGTIDMEYNGKTVNPAIDNGIFDTSLIPGYNWGYIKKQLTDIISIYAVKMPEFCKRSVNVNQGGTGGFGPAV